jgi:hypothetical protein
MHGRCRASSSMDDRSMDQSVSEQLALTPCGVPFHHHHRFPFLSMRLAVSMSSSHATTVAYRTVSPETSTGSACTFPSLTDGALGAHRCARAGSPMRDRSCMPWSMIHTARSHALSLPFRFSQRCRWATPTGGGSYLSLALSIRCLSASSHDDIPITSTVRSATTDPAGAVRGGHRGRACICMMGLLVSRSIGLPFPTAAWAGHRAAGSTHHQPRRPAQKLACGRRREKKRLASTHFSLSRSLSRLSCLACSFSLPHSFDDLSLS